MFSVLLAVQVLLGFAVIGLVLLQQGKGADMGAAFGSGASGTVFGARGSGSFLSRATAILAALFFANSVLLSSPLVLKRGGDAVSVTEQVAPAEPAKPATDLPPGDMPEAPAAGAPGDNAPAADVPEAPAADAPAAKAPAAVPAEVPPKAAPTKPKKPTK